MSEGPSLDVERLTEQLQDLGLTEYQSRAYVAAVELGEARPSKIVEESGVPQARIYDVIDDLSEMGLVEVHEKSGGKTVGAPAPEVALDAYKERHVGEFAETVDYVSSELEKTHEQEQATAGSVTVLSHSESANRHMRQAIEQAEWWIALSLTPERYAELEDEILDALDRGVTVRLVATTSDLGASVSAGEYPDDLLVRSRQLSDLLVASDRSYGVYSGEIPTSDERSYHVVTNQNLVLQFQQYYEQIWTSSRTVQEPQRLPRRYLDPWRAIVDLQAAFDNDEPLEARVVGHETGSRVGGTWNGRIVDYELEGPIDADYKVSIPVKATLLIDVDGEEYSVGGWKAAVEDIAAEGLEISRIDQ
ncbi:TrmB family transcriptional regulator [Salinarchaeum laminariae]|uniref:TrmB family transcriptional regulator n=1 Tax=Salinarchaeum laminariae TaxID=869888 RepID=UPI0020BE38C4|nr:TrmB family transcriptional regulator [Salinarchaeum laminariae]